MHRCRRPLRAEKLCVTGYSDLVGSHTMTATAHDVAGNTGTEQRSYTVLGWTLTASFSRLT